jgi:Domain of unknown function (DUF4190)
MPDRRGADEPDEYDDLPADPPRRRPRDGGDGFATIVPYRNGPALAAYYTGVFGLIPILGVLLGPIAIVLGIVGLVKARRDPKAHGTGHAIAGILLGVIDPFLWIAVWYLFVQEKLR